MRTERQNELLQAAVGIVAKEGFSRLTIRNLASVIGVTEPAIYRHFSSKLALLTAILEDLQAAVKPHFQKLATAEGSTKNILSEFVLGLFSEFKNRPAFALLLFSEEAFHSEPELRPLLLRIMKENLSALEKSFARLQQTGIFRNDVAAEKMAFITMGAIRLTVTRSILHNRKNKTSDQTAGLSDTLVTLFS